MGCFVMLMMVFHDLCTLNANMEVGFTSSVAWKVVVMDIDTFENNDLCVVGHILNGNGSHPLDR